MKETQFFIEYLVVGAFAVATIALACMAVLPFDLDLPSDVTVEAAILVLLLPTVGVAIDCVGKALLWGFDLIAQLLHWFIRTVALRLTTFVTPTSWLAKGIAYVAAHCEDEPKPKISHAQMAKCDTEVVRQSEMRKTRERIARGAFASSAICGLIFWVAVDGTNNFILHRVMSAISALLFCGAWYRYRRRVRVHRNDIVAAYANVLAEAARMHIRRDEDKTATNEPSPAGSVPVIIQPTSPRR